MPNRSIAKSSLTRRFALSAAMLGGLFAGNSEAVTATAKDQTLTAYPERSNLPSCDDRTSQHVAYVTRDEQLVVCLEGSWRSLEAETGPRGADGAVGPAGPQGPRGPDGAAGAAGHNGSRGAIGAAGATGLTGARGRTGVPGQDGVAGQSGFELLVGVSDEPPGHNCVNGGVKVQVGLDLNRDKMLELSEVTQAAFACSAPPAPTACGDQGQACCTDQPCNAGLSCDGTTCVPCDVVCASGDRVACGAALNQALGAGGKIRVCPGEYEAPFPLTADVEILGSGSGDNPAVDTILVGKAGLGSVVPVTSAITVVLDSLRITAGNGAGTNSGGVYVNNAGADVTINGSALVGNTGFYGGGASAYSGKLTITDSEISGNTAAGSGGGVATASQSTITSTRITGNTATLSGGGVFVNSGTATLGAGVTISQNTSNGGGGTGGGIFKFTAGATINNSASVTNNAPENCAGNGFTCP